jgi:hypothetical protein
MATVTKPSLNVSAAVSVQAFNVGNSTTTLYTVPANSYVILNATIEMPVTLTAANTYQAQITVDSAPALSMISDGISSSSSAYGSSSNASTPFGVQLMASAQIVAGPGQVIRYTVVSGGGGITAYGYIRGVVLTNT